MLLQAVLDGAAAFGLRGIATHADDQAARLVPAAPHRQHHFCVGRLAFCRHGRNDLEGGIVFSRHIGRDSSNICQCQVHTNLRLEQFVQAPSHTGVHHARGRASEAKTERGMYG